jgi:hypothetical protein
MMQRAALMLASVALVSLSLVAPVLAASPGNDVYAGRTTIDSLPFSDTVDTTEATTDATDVEANGPCGAPATDASVWYELTPAVDSQVTIEAGASSYPAGIIVVSGSPGSFEFQDCGLFLNVSLTAGVTYSILAFDFDGEGNGGALELNVRMAPPAPTLVLVVDPRGSFSSHNGNATIRGTVTCTGGELDGKNFIDVQLSQLVGRVRISGQGFASFVCDGSAEAWSADVPGNDGRFAGGRATVSVTASACGEGGCAFVEGSQVVRLRK